MSSARWRLLPLSSLVAALSACGSCEEPVRCSTTDFCPDGTTCEDDVCVPLTEQLPVGVDPSDGDLEPDGDDGDGGSQPGVTEPDPSEPDPTGPTNPSDPTDASGPTDPTDPGAPPSCQPVGERCSFVDEDCDGVNNDGLDCTFLAASNGALWRVDPFAGTVDHVLDVTRFGSETLFDIDSAPDGSVLATAGRSLYRVGDNGTLTTLVSGRLPFNPNGLAVDDDGTVFVANHDRLVGSKIVRASSPGVEPSFFTSLGELDSSGDCVRHKTLLLVTVVGEGSDRLARVDLETGDVSVLGDTGFSGVMGLASAFDELWGLTGDGGVLRVDENNGEATLVFESDIPFTGAASRR